MEQNWLPGKGSEDTHLLGVSNITVQSAYSDHMHTRGILEAIMMSSFATKKAIQSYTAGKRLRV